MTAHLPALTVLVPLFIALALPPFSLISQVLVRLLAVAASLAALSSSAASLARVLAQGEWRYHFGGWAPPWGIEYVIDPLAASIAVLVAFFSLLAVVYARPFLLNRQPLGEAAFYSLLLLLTSGLLGMVSTGDVFNLYVFLEISSLSAYALISSGGQRGTLAAFRYLLVGSVAAMFYLLGIGYLYALTGTLNMADLSRLLPPLLGSRVVLLAVALVVVGLGIKMALFPLHGWLPDAYSYASAPAATFIAAVMAKVNAYALYRLLYFVFDATGPVSSALSLVGWAAAAGILFGSVMAIAQRDFGRMLAYSSVAQMGYIALGLSLGNAMGLVGALLHILNHAVMKGCLFMVAGGVRWRAGWREVGQLAQLSRTMPLSMAALVVTALSMIGLPPTAGFFSKYYLVLGSIQAGAWPFAVVLVLSSLLTAVYFFRILENVYLKERGAAENAPAVAPAPSGWPGRELPASMLLPILLLGTGVILLGVFSGQVVTKIIQFAVPGGAVL